MIYIDNSKLEIPEEWKEEARQLTEELNEIPDSERSEFIDRNSRIWRRLKVELERISHSKCWYCEAKNTRSDFHVDHHRPKNRVKNEDGTIELGYWWLAFDYTNFRVACSYCNCLHKGKDGVTRGKSDRFPLDSTCNRASSPESNLNDEQPFLLDPANPADPPLLWFQDDGKACPTHSEACDLVHQRAKVTIEILNLNDIRIVEARKELWSLCISLMKRGDKAFVHYRNRSLTGRREYEAVVRDILRLVQSSAEFSATARACFQGSARRWVRAIVQSAIS